MVVYVCLLVWVFLFLFITIYRKDFQTKLFKFQSMVSFLDNCIAIYVSVLIYIFMKYFMGLEIIKHPFCRYIAWILVAAVYHLPSFQSMGVDMRMNLSLFLTIYLSSILFLLVFHIIFLGLWYIGFVSRVAGKRPEILTILQNCAVSLEDDGLCP